MFQNCRFLGSYLAAELRMAHSGKSAMIPLPRLEDDPGHAPQDSAATYHRTLSWPPDEKPSS